MCVNMCKNVYVIHAHVVQKIQDLSVSRAGPWNAILVHESACEKQRALLAHTNVCMHMKENVCT